MTEPKPIRLLHLSDIHFRAGRMWDADPVLRDLTAFVEAEVQGTLEPDCVAITGDLAYAGKAEEYALARTWLETLWLALNQGRSEPLPRNHLLLVPGNHDADRSRVGTGVKHIQDGLLSGQSQEAIAALLEDEGERGLVLKRHADYLDFYGDWLGEPQPLPWWQRTIEIRGKRLHVAGLDSAWMACGDADRGRLLVGRFPVNQGVLHPDAVGADWRLALLHHPWDYLAEFDTHEARQSIHLHRDVVLRGHLHEGEAAFVRPPDPTRACLELAAGCVYDGSHHTNAFQWIELWSEPRRVRVMFRVWVKGAWQIDRHQPGCPEGVANFDLARDKITDTFRFSSRGPTPIAHPDYLAWLRRKYGRVDLLGQHLQEGRAIALSQVYVPAVTAPTAPPDPIRKPGPLRNTDRACADPSKQQPALLLHRIDQESLYCTAPPGAGKSTFCQWAALQSIADSTLGHPIAPPVEYQEPQPVDLRNRLPLVVPLREFWRVMDCGHGLQTWGRGDLETALADWVDQTFRRRDGDLLTGELLRDHFAFGSVFLLLDGLDEVPISEPCSGYTQYPRILLLSGLEDALPTWKEAGNRILLTSRPYGIDEAWLARLGLPRAPLEPLPEALQRLFVTRWFHTLDRQTLADQLTQAIASREDLAPLAENPMMLTAICVMYDNGGHLPEDRSDLYHDIVNKVLYNRYKDDPREREPVKARLEAIAYGMHIGPDPEEPRQTPAAEVNYTEVERLLTLFARNDAAHEVGRVGPAVRRDELLTRSGLLLPRSNDRAAFYHLSIQEFFAAERIARTCHEGAALEKVFRNHWSRSEWRQTLLFLFAALVLRYRTPDWGLNLLTRLLSELDRAQVKANPNPAVFVADVLDLSLAKGYGIPDELANHFRRLCLDAIADEIAVPFRQTLGLCLGRIIDPRILELRQPAAYVEVPIGDYVCGDDDQPFRILTPFLIARYPVTNSQYFPFIADDGYRCRDYWSADGWAWLQDTGVSEPYYWQDPRRNGRNQPVVGVSFWEAQACCTWAGGRLPTAREWEAAARGQEGNQYPWGNIWADGICNSDAVGLGVTSPVGIFPRSRQVRLGIEDLTGNCWEWVDDLVDPSESGSPRALHGGAYYDFSDVLRAWDRHQLSPEYRGWGVGFRCVQDVARAT